MGKKLFSLCMALALCLGLLPVTALAAAPDYQVIYVGGVKISSTGYWTTDSDGNVTAYTSGDTPTDNYIHYDVANNTLTLHNATIKEEVPYNTSTYVAGAAIGVHNQNGAAELTITLEGTNTIAEVGKGIYVLANSTGGATLTITGDGSLDASASQTGIWVQSNSKNAALCVENAEVTASSGVAFKNGVLVQAKDGSDVSLTVNGGSLTASVNANIWFQFGSGASGSGTPTVTVSNNAIVRANGGIANNSSTSIQYGTGNEENGGIVWNGTGGTVYGNVTLQENLEIGEGESLTIGDGASLNTGSHEVIVNGGTLTGEVNGQQSPQITTPPQSQIVTEGESATFTIEASGSEPLSYQWQESTDSGSNWKSIAGATSTSYEIATTSTDMSDHQYRCVVTASGVSVVSDAATLTVNAPTTYTISADVDPAGAGTVKVNGSGTSATVTANSDVTLTATANDGYRFTGWMENDQQVSTNATYTFNANGDRTLTAKFEKKVTGVTLNTETLELFTGGSATLTATVEPSDAANQNVTWQSDNANVATVEGGTVTAVSAGTATITVTTEDGAKTATCTVTVSRYSSGGGPTTYAVTAPDVENGTVRVSPSRASRGTTVTITVTPDEGYELESLTVLDSRDNEITLTDKGDGKYTFTMPSGRVTVEASFAEIAPEPLPFGDVDDGDWFADAVRFVYENGMMNGVSETSFAPHAATSRSMIVTILYRLEGEPVVDYAMGFTDVAGDAYYAEAVRWAASEGIVGGYGGGLFGSDDAVTREQLAVILYRYAVYKGYDVSIGEDTNILSYDDFADLSEYAIPAMQWACGAGVITGVTDATLVPQGEATRAQVAAMLMRFVEAIG